MPEKQLDFSCTEPERYYSQNQSREKKLREKLLWRIRIELEHIVKKTSQQIAKTFQNSKHFKKNPQNIRADTKTLVHRKPVIFVLQEVRRENTVKFFLKNFFGTKISTEN